MPDIRELLVKYNKPGPRYTSYPPATYFSDEFTAEDYTDALIASNTAQLQGVSSQLSAQLQGVSLYIHIPFCNEKCFFCGCNAFLKKNSDFVERYVQALISEIETVSNFLDKRREVIQIHWGGGTPNAISFHLIAEIMYIIRKEFTLAENCEVAMECNPADLDDEKIVLLSMMGFNRVSLGIQDLRSDVLKVVNRRASAFPVDELVKKLRTVGIENINIDLIYGLPLQTVDSFNTTIGRIIEIAPDRLATFSYAHLPQSMKVQYVLEKYGLPGPLDKISMLLSSRKKLSESGYTAIGMDHYARSDDPLTIALNNKTLHRNFQGYCTRETTGQVYAFGCSGITQLSNSYAQNERDPQKYIEMIEQTKSGLVRGYSVSVEEQICRAVINEIMCNLYLDFKHMADKYGVTIEQVKNVVDYSADKLQPFVDDNLIVINDDTINICQEGAFIVRNIAMCFDPKLKNDTGIYSRTI